MNKTLLRTALLLCAAGAFGACDSPTESESDFDVEFSALPDPAIAAESHGVTYAVTNADDTTTTVEYPWTTSFTIEMREEGGIDLDITAVNLVVQQASGGIVITPSGGDIVHYRFTSSASGNFLPANGSAAIGFAVWYDNPNDQKEALMSVTVGFKDADGHLYTDTCSVRVAP